jgi:Flp pilus assembly protein TadG
VLAAMGEAAFLRSTTFLLFRATVRTFRHRFREEGGQAAVEFALVLPLLLLVLFAIVEFARTYNAFNDLNQMAADGARFAAVGRYPGDAQLRTDEADTNVTRAATLSLSYNGGTCVVGGSVSVSAAAPVAVSAILKVGTLNLNGKATMRVERCPAP